MSDYLPPVTNKWIRSLDDLVIYQTTNRREAYYITHFADGWEETTARTDPPGVRTFRRFVTADIDNDGVVHVREWLNEPPFAVGRCRCSMEYREFSTIAFTGEYCDQ